MFGVSQVRPPLPVPRWQATTSDYKLLSKDGHSVLAHVRDFLPYFWIAAPRGFKDADCVPFCDYLNVSSATPLFYLHHSSAYLVIHLAHHKQPRQNRRRSDGREQKIVMGLQG